jgi:hypothetical protein
MTQPEIEHGRRRWEAPTRKATSLLAENPPRGTLQLAGPQIPQTHGFINNTRWSWHKRILLFAYLILLLLSHEFYSPPPLSRFLLIRLALLRFSLFNCMLLLPYNFFYNSFFLYILFPVFFPIHLLSSTFFSLSSILIFSSLHTFISLFSSSPPPLPYYLPDP